MIEQAERVRGGGSPGPAQQSGPGDSGGQGSPDHTHSPTSPPMDKPVTTTTERPEAGAARRRARPEPGQEASDNRADELITVPPVDRSVHTPGNTSVHTLSYENNGQGTQGGSVEPVQSSLPDPASEAIADLALFESAGATSFDLTILGEVQLNSTRKLIDFGKEIPADRLLAMLPRLVERCERERLNLIVRPRIAGADRRLVQLDDLDQAALDLVRGLAFRIVETSPGNYQAWVCVLGADEEIERKLKRGVGADIGANGATRVAGSINVKEKYREAGYPRVRLIAGMLGKLVSNEDLTELLEPEPQPPCVPPSSVPTHAIAHARL